MKGLGGLFVVLDSDFLSSFLKIGKLDLVRSFYQVPAFLLACKISGFLDREEIAATIRDLEEKDRYSFRQEVLTRLLTES